MPKIAFILLLATRLPKSHQQQLLLTIIYTSGAVIDRTMKIFHVSGHGTIAATYDGTSVNIVSINNLTQVFSTLIEIACFSHTLDQIWQNVRISNVLEIVNTWVSPFSHLFEACEALWKQTGLKVKLPSKIRRWSRWEVIKQRIDRFPEAHGLVVAQRELSPPLLARCRECQTLHEWDGMSRWSWLQLWTRVRNFVKLSYNLEGDGPLSLVAYQGIKRIQICMKSGPLPTVESAEPETLPKQ